jgi:hypothetical protein
MFKVSHVAILAFISALIAETETVSRLRAPSNGLLTSNDAKAFAAAQHKKKIEDQELYLQHRCDVYCRAMQCTAVRVWSRGWPFSRAPAATQAAVVVGGSVCPTSFA